MNETLSAIGEITRFVFLFFFGFILFAVGALVAYRFLDWFVKLLGVGV